MIIIKYNIFYLNSRFQFNISEKQQLIFLDVRLASLFAMYRSIVINSN